MYFFIEFFCSFFRKKSPETTRYHAFLTVHAF
jgi:hypothetical protein